MPKKSRVRKKLTRREQRDLDIEIGFLEGVVHRDPKFVEAFELLGDDYTRRGRFHLGLKVDLRLARFRPTDPRVLYNLACSYALVRRPDKAVVALDRALSAGYDDYHWIAKDPDLDNVRRHPSFKKLKLKIRPAPVSIAK